MPFVYLVLFFFGAILCCSCSVISYFYVLPPKSRMNASCFDFLHWNFSFSISVIRILLSFSAMICDRKALYLLKIVLDIYFGLKFYQLDFNGIFLRLAKPFTLYKFYSIQSSLLNKNNLVLNK